jgi:hypothetical protein
MALDWLDAVARGLERVDWWPVWIRDPDPEPPCKPKVGRKIISIGWAWLVVIAAAGSMAAAVQLGYLKFP